MKNLALAALALGLAACGGNAEESAATDETPPPPPAAVDAGSGETAPPDRPPAENPDTGADQLAQGRWFASEVDGNPAALFGAPNSEAQFSLACEGGQLVVTRMVRASGDTAKLDLASGAASRSLTAGAQREPLPRVTGRFPASDPFAAVLARSSDPLAVRVAEGAAFTMPSDAALRSVVSACREG